MRKRISRKSTFTASEAADELGLHVSTIYRYIHAGRLRAYQYPTGTLRIARTALMEFRQEALLPSKLIRDRSPGRKRNFKMFRSMFAKAGALVEALKKIAARIFLTSRENV